MAPRKLDTERKKRLVERVKEIRLNSFVTIIQSRFRGNLQRMRDRKIFGDIGLENWQQQPLRQRLEESRCLRKLASLSFQSVETVVFQVDGAVGLPPLCAATRVSARLLAKSKRQLGDIAVSYCQLESESRSPVFNLTLKVPGR